MAIGDQSISPLNEHSRVLGTRFLKYWLEIFPSLELILRFTCLLPYQGKYQLFGILYHCSLHCVAIMFTIMWILKEKEEMEALNNSMVESLFQIITSSALISAYLYIGAAKDEMLEVVARMWYDYTEEIQNIIINLTTKAVYFIKIQAILLIVTCASYGAAPVVIPFFMASISSSNQTFKKTLPLHHECSVDEDKYFYILFTYQFIALTDFGILVAAMNFLYCLLLTSAVAGIRGLEHLLKKIDAEYSYKISKCDETANEWIYLQLKEFVRYHQTLTNFYECARGLCRPIILGLLFGTSSCIILALTSMVISMNTDLVATARMFVGAVVSIAIVIFICFPSQLMKNASDEIFLTCCKLKYQNYPPKIRKILLFIMMRTEKSFALTAGPMVELNFETCSSIIKSSFSYTAAFRSVYKSQ